MIITYFEYPNYLTAAGDCDVAGILDDEAW